MLENNVFYYFISDDDEQDTIFAMHYNGKVYFEIGIDAYEIPVFQRDSTGASFNFNGREYITLL